MKTSLIGINLIKKFEGFSAKVYLDSANLPTIGYGHLIKKGEKFTTITEEQAVEILKKDLNIAERAVNRLINVPLNQYQFNALVSFTFNLGSGSLQRSTLRAKLNRGQYVQASDEFLKWVYAGGRKLKGLIRRRKEERLMFLSESVYIQIPNNF